MKATDFNLLDQSGESHKLSDYKGKWVVLYFYPKDDTPGCTKEACNFRDNITEIEKLGVQVLGVSKDNVASHKKFAEKYSLNFPLLSDSEKTVHKDYNIRSRTTFLINFEGKIVKTYEHVNPTQHADQVVSDLKKLM
jgi:peroxiredoxin Q/BCP